MNSQGRVRAGGYAGSCSKSDINPAYRIRAKNLPKYFPRGALVLVQDSAIHPRHVRAGGGPRPVLVYLVSQRVRHVHLACQRGGIKREEGRQRPEERIDWHGLLVEAIPAWMFV